MFKSTHIIDIVGITNKKTTSLSLLLLLIVALNLNATTEANTNKLATKSPTTSDFTRTQHFIFTPGNARKTNQISGDTIYTDERGYGFDLGTQMGSEPHPFYFSVQVPEGNYAVELELGSHKHPTSTTVKAESRRLYLENVKADKGEFVKTRFIVNIRTPQLQPPEKNAPGGTMVELKEREKNQLHWDNKLTLEFTGSSPALRSLRIRQVSVPSLYLVGDSTVTDQPFEPAASWGQMLPRFFTDGIAIANHAESGETMKSFIASLRFAKVLESMKAGDFLLIQFGHNDQKKQWPQTYVEADTTYKDYLRVFIAEARLRGATPILITSVQRRTFDALGKMTNSHGRYPQAVREVAQEKNVALIDLDAMSTQLYEALGMEKAPLAFNDNGKDATHHNNYGAYQLAQCVAQGIRNSGLPLAKYLRDDFITYDPAHPSDPSAFMLSPSLNTSTSRPDGN
ncbi:MAG TPA: rhamnogalacturonan acetylesterase [Cellvibrio sp.]|nr:rhamnogalacturonan acetylesterase [Cellvibrio sp.]